MRSVLRLVLLAIIVGLGWLQPAALADATAPSRVILIQGYDAPQYVDALNEVAVERGPPTAYDCATHDDANAQALIGAWARSNRYTTWATCEYDALVRCVPTAQRSDGADDQVGGAEPGSVVIPRCDVAANGGDDAVRFVTGADGVTTDLLSPSGKLPFPKHLVPEGMTPNAYGNSVWGVGPQGAKDLIGTRSASELESLGLTVRGAEQWQDFYLNVYTLNPRNAAAGARVDLMQDIINTLRGPR